MSKKTTSHDSSPKAAKVAPVDPEKSRDRFADLYDFAPVGYLTLDCEGMINEINLTGAALLMLRRDKLPYQHFASFVVTEDKDRWHSHFMNVQECSDTQTCELALQRGDGSRFYAHLNCLRLKNGDEKLVMRVSFIDITQRNALVDALDDGKRFFSTLAQVGMVGIYRTDARGNGLYSNEYCQKIAGLTADEALGAGWLQAIHTDDRENVAQAWYASTQAQRDFIMEYRIQQPDGNVRWVQGHAAAERDAKGEVVGYVGIITDITMRKQAEKVLRENEAHYRQVINTAMDGFRLSDSQGNILDANAAYASMTGYSIDELKKMHISQLSAKESPEEVAKHIAKVISQGHDRFETVNRHKDGHYINTEVSATFMPESRQLFIFSRDITERKKSEAKTAALIHRNSVFMQSTPEFVHILDDQGNIIEANDAFCRHLGYTKEEALQLSVPDFDAKFTADEAQTIIGALWGSHFTFDSVHRRKDGALVDVEITVSGVELEGQKRLFALGRDITERKKIEAEILLNSIKLKKANFVISSDLRVAKKVMERIMRSRGLHDPQIRYFLRPTKQFSGDIIAAARDNKGDLRIMLADVTGHGLQAALFLLPIFRVFSAMVKKGFSTSDIVTEMNQTMRGISDTGHFIAAAVAHIARDGSSIEIWNGGIPAVFHVQKNGELRKFCSRHLPLGVADADAFKSATEIFHALPGVLLLCSDGLIEAQNALGEQFGWHRFEILLRASKADELFDNICSALESHLGGGVAHDDLSLVIAQCGD